MSCERYTKLFESCIQSQKHFRTESRTGDDIGQFSVSPINKAPPRFRKRLREYVKATGGYFQHLYELRKVFTVALNSVCAVINAIMAYGQFLIKSKQLDFHD